MSNNEYDPHITVDNIAKIKDPNYSIKALAFDHLNKKIETPFKVLSGKNIEKSDFNLQLEADMLPLFENERYVYWKNWNTLKNIVTNSGGHERRNKFRNFFNLRESLWPGNPDSPLNTLSLVFYRNPFEDIILEKSRLEGYNQESYIMLLNLIYTHSSALILTPDFILNKESIIEDYLNRIDYSVKILSDWNKKPVFVPVQINLPLNKLDKVISHYQKKNYTNLWINFETEPCYLSYSESLRTIRQIINNYYKDTDVVLYYSHVGKEINPNIRDTKVAASDILTQFNGADIIGVNRSPPGFSSDEGIEKVLNRYNFKSKEEYDIALLTHKNRIFHPNSYYYYNIENYPEKMPFNKEILFKEPINKLLNSILLYREVFKVKKFVEENNPKNAAKEIKKQLKERPNKKDKSFDNCLKQYIEDISAIKENKDIKESIFPKTIQTELNQIETDLGSL